MIDVGGGWPGPSPEGSSCYAGLISTRATLLHRGDSMSDKQEPNPCLTSTFALEFTLSPDFIQRYEEACDLGKPWQPKTKRERQGFAAAMRRHPTKAERTLHKELRWLRKHASSKKENSILLYTRQQLKCGYILDFYLKKCRLAIEVDGPNHSSGRQHRYDEKRDRRLAAVGIKTLRFTNEEVLRNPVTVVDLIYKEAATRFIPKQKRGGKRRKTNRGRIG